MKKLIIITLIISNYIESSLILKKSMDYTSPTDQIVIRKTNNEIRNSNIHKTLISYKNYLETNEGEDINWDNLEEKGFVQEDIDTMKRWMDKFYFNRPISIAHSKLPACINDEFNNITNEIGLNLETQEVEIQNLETNKFETKKLNASRLGPIEIREGIIDFIMLKTNQKYYYIKHEYRERLLQDEKNYKRNFLDIVNRYIPKFEYIKNIDSNSTANSYDFDYLIIKAQDFKNQNQTTLSKLNTILTNDHNITVIVAFDDNTTDIDYGFKVPNNISKLVIIGPNITSIGPSFLFGCTELTAIDLNPLKKVKFLNWWFLSGCTGLTNLDFTSLKNVTIIGNYFLSGCTRLTTLSLKGLENVAFIDDNFLKDCTGLTTLDLTPLKNVPFIGYKFLSGCTGLKDLNLNSLEEVILIVDDFLKNCDRLKTIKIEQYHHSEYFLHMIPKHINVIQNK